MITMNSVSLFFQYIKQGNAKPCEEFKSKYLKRVDHIQNITYETFFTNHLTLNKPCIIIDESTNFWKSSKEWVTNGKPNLNYLEEVFGSAVVPVAYCNIREYNSQKKKSMLFKDYINYCRKRENDKNLDLLYLKDWHFKRKFPSYKAYETPEYFQSDWLNEICEKLDDDYQFVYMGPKGTWTPLHSDVFGSYSWSINICGRKKWLLFPPGYENLLKDERKQLPYMVNESYLKLKNVFYLEIIQEPQEIIFVPSGWYHQVLNLEDTISINHNWYNGCNIQFIWKCLHEAALDVENEIADCKEFEGWEDQLQIILKAHHGMNYCEFLSILQSITTTRIENVENSLGNLNWHFIFDLLSIKYLCSEMDSQLPDMLIEPMQKLHLKITEFLADINDVKNIY